VEVPRLVAGEFSNRARIGPAVGDRPAGGIEGGEFRLDRLSEFAKDARRRWDHSTLRRTW